MAPEPADPLKRLRQLCLELPEVTERLNHGEPAWAVRDRALATYSERHPPDRVSFWCPAPPGEAEAMAGTDPQRFFRPRFGGRKWVGIYLDVPIDWTEVHELLVQAYHLIAPKRLVDELDRRSAPPRT